MKKDVREPGLYYVPGRDMSKSPSQEEMQAHMDKISKGPYGFMVIHPNGRDPSLGKRLPIELGTNIVCALLAAILVSQLRPGFIMRVACVTLVGILASIMTLVPYWNWYGFPTDFTLAQMVVHTVGWFLAGIVARIDRAPFCSEGNADHVNSNRKRGKRSSGTWLTSMALTRISSITTGLRCDAANGSPTSFDVPPSMSSGVYADASALSPIDHATASFYNYPR